MALLPCKECGNQVSTEAKRCPSCGAKAPKKPVSKVFIAGAIILAILVGANMGGEKASAPNPQPFGSPLSSSAPVEPVKLPDPEWEYQSESDQMTDKRTDIAYLRSTNSLALDFPYAGVNHGHLLVRKHPKFGTDVIISVDKGQILCRAYDGCSVTIRFDEKPAAARGALPPSDHDSTQVFLRDASSFIGSAKTAKRILVQVEMYKSGIQTLEFSTASGLVWPRP